MKKKLCLLICLSLALFILSACGLLSSGKAMACYTPGLGGIAEAVMKMAFGNGFGFAFSPDLSVEDLFAWKYGSFLLETNEEIGGTVVGTVTDEPAFTYGAESVPAGDISLSGNNEGIFDACKSSILTNPIFAVVITVLVCFIISTLLPGIERKYIHARI